MDKIELLKTVGFHVHATDGACEWADWWGAGRPASLAPQLS
jgi:hypothetical protein